MTAAADAAPLIILSKLGLLHLLRRLYERVIIPSSVHQEAVTRGLEAGRPDAYTLHMAVQRGEIEVVQVQETALTVGVASLPLGAGEKDVLRLGLQEAAEWLILDDLPAREAATRLGLRVKGTVGIVVDAYRQGLLSRDERDFAFGSLLSRDDIWISELLVRRVWAELQREDA